MILDARTTNYIDPDVIELIRDFKELTDPPYDVIVSLVGFNGKFRFEDHVQYEAASPSLRPGEPQPRVDSTDADLAKDVQDSLNTSGNGLRQIELDY